MTDLEMTRLCAEAVGIELVADNEVLWVAGFVDAVEYDPLTDDAQAMELVKKLGLTVSQDPDGCWHVMTLYCDGPQSAADLNRAIVECVARMQAGKRDA